MLSEQKTSGENVDQTSRTTICLGNDTVYVATYIMTKVGNFFTLKIPFPVQQSTMEKKEISLFGSKKYQYRAFLPQNPTSVHMYTLYLLIRINRKLGDEKSSCSLDNHASTGLWRGQRR